MSIFHLIYAIWGLLSFTCFFIVVICASWCPYQNFQQSNQRFEQKTDKFWVFSEQTERWVEAKLPYDLLSCVNGDCTKVGSILQAEKRTTQEVLELEDKLDEQKTSDENKDSKMESEDVVLVQRKRISLTKISETSVWVTGERSAISVLVINQTILALSEAGKLYQKNLLIKAGVALRDGQRAYFCTTNGTLVELAWVEPPRWINHGQPARANVAAIADAASRREVVYTISQNHHGRDIWQDKTSKAAPLKPSKGCSLHGLSDDHSESLFLLTKLGLDMEVWKSHQHPLHAKAARGIAGLQLYVGRILFPLDDGRLAELHTLGLGGESSGPSQAQNIRRKSSTKYVWSILDVPESEGWNAEYCTEERGLRNCLTGIKDESEESVVSSVTGRRKQSQAQNHYLSLGGTSGGRLIQSSEEYNHVPDNWISSNFRLRLMDVGKSFFLITDDGLIFEYICIESAWIWLRHESFTPMKGILSNYNGSLFMVDTRGSLLLREKEEARS
ncbi:hypothetical protein VNO80_08654 [Phaseolus coccineus]|uniref:Uncharacterized protein n=1 Tax=Phaseolus coccineus TaxID=3886 RepID=A0AAN9N4R5_PHACN